MADLLVPEGLTDVKPIREIIYDHLRQAILDGRITPGERLVERDIAAQFNASRTPVREAVRKLESEGYVEYLARKGVVVRGFNIEQIEEIYSIRKELECLAVRNAITRISSEQIVELKKIVDELEREWEERSPRSTSQGLHDFDNVVFNAAAMPLLTSFLHTLRDSLQRFSRINLTSHPRRKDAVKEHKEILEAIIDKDAERAEKLVRKHIENAREELIKRINTSK